MNGHRPRSASWLATLLLLVLAAVPASARPGHSFDRTDQDQRQILLRADAIDALADRFRLEILESHDTPDGPVYLVSVPRGKKAASILGQISREAGVKSASGVALASLPAMTLSAVEATDETAEDLAKRGRVISPCLAWINPNGVWRGYADQRAAQMTQLHLGQAVDNYWCGKGMTIAVIDTAIDTEHRILANAIVDGYDFVNDSAGTDAIQTSDLDTKTRTIVESDRPLVEDGVGSISMLDASAVIMGELSEEVLADLATKGPYYGHGTMVAGLIRLTAPAAKIMPLETFNEEGVGHPFDIVRAIDYAVDNGATVINMSFSITESTPELLAALERARKRGVMTVAAAGNNGEASQIFPAAYGATIGVAATDFNDQLTEFSNYGLVTADLAAPGSGVVTLFPGGLFATGWGTSFSTPLVAGNVALIRTYYLGSNKAAHDKTRVDLLLGTQFYSYLWDYILSSGRLDTVGAVLQARN